jgi:hypothetical protein
MIMSKSLDLNTGVLSLEQLETVNGGEKVVIIGCTDPRNGHPAPDGTIYWNIWIGQPYPLPRF